jgi:hypothetical protein
MQILVFLKQKKLRFFCKGLPLWAKIRKKSFFIKYHNLHTNREPNQLNFEEKVQKKTVGRFGVILSLSLPFIWTVTSRHGHKENSINHPISHMIFLYMIPQL